MIKLENVEVFGWGAAVRGMRAPMNSWRLSDSCECWDERCPEDSFIVGKNDLALMRKLAKAGNDHGKFARMINVTLDITAPVYIWAEIDTYKVSTVRNSCSFMHKGVSKPFELSDFSLENDEYSYELGYIVELLNSLRDNYLETKDPKYFLLIRQFLPQGYMVKSTWQANYQVLWNIYKARKDHRLPEWREFCKWVETLPHFKEIYLEE